MIIINNWIRYITATIKLDELQIAKKSSLVHCCLGCFFKIPNFFCEHSYFLLCTSYTTVKYILRFCNLVYNGRTTEHCDGMVELQAPIYENKIM